MLHEWQVFSILCCCCLSRHALLVNRPIKFYEIFCRRIHWTSTRRRTKTKLTRLIVH